MKTVPVQEAVPTSDEAEVYDGTEKKDIFSEQVSKCHVYGDLAGPYSQNGEYGIIKYIFKKIGSVNNYYVDMGGGDGINLHASNTADLRINDNWKGLLLDQTTARKCPICGTYPDINLHGGVTINKDNVNDILKKHDVPFVFDFLDLDIDGDDYWVWEALEYKPRIVLLETQPGITNKVPLTIKEGESMCHHQNHNTGVDHYNYFGANLHALYDLAIKKGYEFVTTCRWNAFFIDRKEFHKLNIASIPKEVVITKYFEYNKYWGERTPHGFKKEWVIPE